MIITTNNNCPHIGELIPIEKFKSIKFSALSCKNCEEKNDLWICLFCGEAFCGRYKNKHFYTHYQENNEHCIGISTLDLSVWCYNCTTKDFNDPGSYIESELIQKYVDILCSIKFSDNANNNLDIVSNSISLEEANKIKYENFMELLKNNKIKNCLCLVGPYIYDSKDNVNLFLDNKENIIKKILEKHELKENEIDYKKLFKEKPGYLYEYFSNFNVEIEANSVHNLLKFLVDSDIIKTILTENIDNLENSVGIPEENLKQVVGNLFRDKCNICKEQINKNELKKCIKLGEIYICKKCNNPYEITISLDDEKLDKDLLEKISYKDTYDACFVIGTKLNRELFNSIVQNLSIKSNWIIFINNSKDSKLNLDFGSVFNRNIYLTMDYIDKIYNILTEIKNNNKKTNMVDLEKLIDYKKDSNGNITSPLLDKIKSYEPLNLKKYSIFDSHSDKYKEDIIYIRNLIKNYINTKEIKEDLSILVSGSIGSMLGMGIADAMGHRYEFEDVRYGIIDLEDMGIGPGGAFALSPGQWTDDTSMGLCLADSLIMKEGNYDAHDLMHRFLCWWNYGYNNAFRFDNGRDHSVGLGGQINGSFMYYVNSPKEMTECGNIYSSGIGSIMRNAAVPICYHKNTPEDLNKAMEIAYKQSKLTHQGNEAAECCRLLTYIVVKILNREKEEKLNDILDKLDQFETKEESVKCLAQSKQEKKEDKDDPDRDWNWKKTDFRYSPTRSKQQPGYIGSYAMDGLAMALHVCYYTDSFEKAIIKVVNLRGDADSVGAVVGQIAGAYYGVKGIPPEWIQIISQWDNYEIPLRGYILQKLIKS